MMLLNRRPVASLILAKGKDSRVGYVSVDESFEIAHYYHTKAPRDYEHNFCYRNFRLKSIRLKWTAQVSGPADYNRNPGYQAMTLSARQMHHDPLEIKEFPTPGTLHLHDANSGEQVVTEVVLSPPKGAEAFIPGDLRLVSSGFIGRLDACCPRKSLKKLLKKRG